MRVRNACSRASDVYEVFILKKEFLFIYNYQLNREFLNRERRIED